MTTAAPIPDDQLADLVNAETQRVAARMVQDVFAGVFRQAVMADAADDEQVLAEVGERCFNWCKAGGSDEGTALRMALLITGLDQWGLAYTQAFKLAAIPALTAVLGGLRGRLDARGDSLFQQYFQRLAECEGDAIDFKVSLRRAIHIALWHAMIACETKAQAEGVLQVLGSMMLALEKQMPQLGWRMLADALASIQIALLSDEIGASTLAQESTQQLFASLRQALPAERYQAILAHSGQAVVAWQQARRSAAN